MREPRNRKEKIVKEGIETTADFVGGFIILLVISLPIAYMVHGWSAVVGTLFVVVIIASCLIFSGNNDKKENKYEYEPIERVMKKCPYCGKEVPDNAIRCRYCKRMFETKYAKNTNKNSETWEDHQKTIYELKDCPHCDHTIKEGATRCPFCKNKV